MSGPVKPQREDIAIVGLAGRFPGAPDAAKFWALVRDGQSAIRKLTEDELKAAGVSQAERANRDYVPYAPVLDDITKFDAAFFGLSAREASVMDPAHRIFLELAWQAFEDAGYAALPEEGRVGVFATSGAPLYLAKNVQTHPEIVQSMGDFLVRHTGNDMNFLSTRVSYHMDLRGPSLNVQTACSSALVAVHLACRSLIEGDCDMALAGGATVLVPQQEGYLYREGEILSPDGQCRPFDAQSAGTVFGSGAGAVVLKRLSDALDHGDTIHAVIKGSAMNNDGAAKVGYLAPGVEGQVRVIEAALNAAQVDAASVSYVEAHGTGTLVGDPIEAEALISALGSASARCGVGSVKSNIGHLGEAAGIASLIKVIMALKHRQLPPSLGFKSLNPAIPFEDTRFYINAALSDWQSDAPRRCGVTALGAGGTNCHIVLEQAPEPLPGEGARTQNLFVLSAKTQSALKSSAQNLAAHFAGDCDLADAAATLALGRRALNHRRMVVAGSRAEAVARLKGDDARHVFSGDATAALPVVFLYPGGGAQYAGMAADLYTQEPVFAEAVDACLAIIEPMIGRDLRPLMFPEIARQAEATRTLERPSLTLPSLFTIEYALTKLFQYWGVTPQASLGHSVGEYMAACLSGVMSLADALKLVVTRGRLFEKTEQGGMLAVGLSERALLARLPSRVSIAAVNAPELSVASGPASVLRRLQSGLEADGISVTPIRIDVAAHSALLDPVLAEFREVCRTIRLSPPTRPFLSNVTGDWITAAEATDAEYWVRHLRSPVRFADDLATLAQNGACILVEMGPGRTLTMLAKAQAKPFAHAFNSLRHPQEDDSDLACALSAVGKIWVSGGAIDWTAFYQDQLRNRVPLPVYPFDRQTHWIEPGQGTPRLTDALIKREDMADWFSTVGFQDAPLINARPQDPPKTWLILCDRAGPAKRLAADLGAERFVIARHDSTRDFRPATHWTLDFNNPSEIEALLEFYEQRHGAPDRIVFLASQSSGRDTSTARLHHFVHPLHLMQALGARNQPAHVSFLTHGLSDAAGAKMCPERALILGPAFVGPRELPGVTARCIDVPKAARAPSKRLRKRLADELRAETRERLVALRETGRFAQTMTPISLPDAEPGAWLREDGVYVITGGLGGIALEIAAHMARQKNVKLALLSRTGLPEGEAAGLIRARRAPQHLYDRLMRIDALRAQGSDVRVFACDIADEAALAQTLANVRGAFGPINGVLHAAGVIDDAPMMMKSPSGTARVLAPKFEGTCALDAHITEDLDIFVLFSSVASYLGLPGQADYAAGNAFLDAFARDRATRKKGRTLTVNWSAWRDTGMAEGQRKRQRLGVEPGHACASPLFEGFSDHAGVRDYIAAFRPDSDWLFTEHKVKGGQTLLPGTAFVELARAAVADLTGQTCIELSDLSMLAPFQASGEDVQRLIVRLAPAPTGYSISMIAGGDTTETPLVTCEARTIRVSAQKRMETSEILRRCGRAVDAAPDRLLDQTFMNFGPRWANIVSTRYGEGEAMLSLALPDTCLSDLDTHGLHPALLDMATGGVQKLIQGFNKTRDFYVPVGYERVSVYAAMPARLLSHVRYEGDGGDGFARFDVTLCDEAGHVFAEIEHFTMKRVDAQSAILSKAVRPSMHADPMEAILQQAIAPEEGVRALERALAQPALVQAMISSIDARRWLDQLNAPTMGATDADLPGAFDRADEGFSAPATATERALAKLWSDLLGVRQVGRDDDFFDLGGNSLVGVRLFAAIRKQFGTTMPMSVLFEAPTLALLAQRLKPDDDGTAASPARAQDGAPLVCIQPGAAHRRPLFCVHGALGNVVGFKPLATHIGTDQPFYGLQAHGIDGVTPPIDSIPEMARLYIRAIKTRQMQGPYMLAGYSGGGVIAQEMTHQLEAAGEEVCLLVMIDTLEPSQMLKPISHWDRAKQVSHVKPDQFWRALRRRLANSPAHAAAARAPATALEVASMAVEAAYLKAQGAHAVARVSSPLVLIRAREARMFFLRAGAHLGWDEWVSGRIDVIEADGNHETVCLEPAVIAVAAALRARIDETGAPPVAAGVSSRWQRAS